MQLARRLDHDFADPLLLHQALSHRSWCGEQDGAPSNERLEFLGDAVLGMVVAEHALPALPDFPEGKLAKVRSAVVNARGLAGIAEELGVGEVLLLGRGEEASGGRTKASILADALEAVIGAVYLDAGWTAAEATRAQTGGRADRPGCRRAGRLRPQEPAAGAGGAERRRARPGTWSRAPARTTTATTWPRSTSAGVPQGRGEGSSKKDAEQAAALDAWQELSAVGA